MQDLSGIPHPTRPSSSSLRRNVLPLNSAQVRKYGSFKVKRPVSNRKVRWFEPARCTICRETSLFASPSAHTSEGYINDGQKVG